MKIGNLRINWHRHEWEKVVIYVDKAGGINGYLLKVGEKCKHKDCYSGYYKSVYYILLKEKPEVIKID